MPRRRGGALNTNQREVSQIDDGGRAASVRHVATRDAMRGARRQCDRWERCAMLSDQHDRVADIMARDWDTLAGGNLYQSHAWLSFLERGAIGTGRYLTLRR